MAQARKARRLGRGSISKYKTKQAMLWRWQAWVDAPISDAASGRVRIGGSGYKTAIEADLAMSTGIAEHDRIRAQKLSPEHPQFEEFARLWLSQLKLAPATIKGYERLLRCHVFPYIGNRRLKDLTSHELAATYKALSAQGRRDVIDPGGELSPNTVNKVHIVIGSILEAAIDENHIASNPARRQRIVNAPTGAQIRAHQEEVKTWDESQLQYFLQWNQLIYKDELNTMWKVAGYTGMRRGEVAALKWGDIDFENNIISIRRAADPIMIRQTKTTKTGRQRPVTMHIALAAELKRYKQTRSATSKDLTTPSSFVFGLKDGQLRSPNDISARWARAVKKAVAHSTKDRELAETLPVLTLKGLRHTHATMLMRSGVNPKIVQERLGHSTISTTMNIYSHVTPTMQRDAVDAMFSKENSH